MTLIYTFTRGPYKEVEGASRSSCLLPKLKGFVSICVIILLYKCDSLSMSAESIRPFRKVQPIPCYLRAGGEPFARLYSCYLDIELSHSSGGMISSTPATNLRRDRLSEIW